MASSPRTGCVSVLQRFWVIVVFFAAKRWHAFGEVERGGHFLGVGGWDCEPEAGLG